MQVTNHASQYLAAAAATTTPATAAAKSVPDPQGASKSGAPTDSVTLSPEAQALMESGASVPSGVEQYAIPGWLADYGFELPGQLGVSGNWFAEQNPKAAAASQQERNEYSALVRGHYRDLLDTHGIADTASHYQAMIADPNSSEALRQEMADLVRGDARLMELMGRMGKSTLLL